MMSESIERDDDSHRECSPRMSIACFYFKLHRRRYCLAFPLCVRSIPADSQIIVSLLTAALVPSYVFFTAFVVQYFVVHWFFVLLPSSEFCHAIPIPYFHPNVCLYDDLCRCELCCCCSVLPFFRGAPAEGNFQVELYWQRKKRKNSKSIKIYNDKTAWKEKRAKIDSATHRQWH